MPPLRRSAPPAMNAQRPDRHNTQQVNQPARAVEGGSTKSQATRTTMNSTANIPAPLSLTDVRSPTAAALGPRSLPWRPALPAVRSVHSDSRSGRPYHTGPPSTGAQRILGPWPAGLPYLGPGCGLPGSGFPGCGFPGSGFPGCGVSGFFSMWVTSFRRADVLPSMPPRSSRVARRGDPRSRRRRPASRAAASSCCPPRFPTHVKMHNLVHPSRPMAAYGVAFVERGIG